MKLKTHPFSPLLGANLCLSDSKRVNAFEKAISETVKKGDVVLEVGSGTGILALLALKQGASKVYAVEIEPYLCQRIRKIAKQNGFAKHIQLINSDIFELDSLEDNIDVVLMELLTTGLIEEAQIPAYNHLLQKKIIQPATRIIPKRFETNCTLLDYNFIEHGFYMPRAKHTTLEYFKKILSDKKTLSVIEFNGTKKNPKLKKSIEFVINNKGKVNSIGLMSNAKLSEKTTLGESTWINNSMAIPLDRNLYVKRNDRIKLDISYVMGRGFSTMQLTAFKGLANACIRT